MADGSGNRGEPGVFGRGELLVRHRRKVEMSGIMMLADHDWLAFHEKNSLGKLVVFYASPHKFTDRECLDPLFCVQSGKLPRSIVAVGRIQAQPILDQDTAWAKYGSALGAETEEEWRAQAAVVLEKSRKTYRGQMLAIELIDFRTFSDPVEFESVGLEDTGWSDKKDAKDYATAQLLRLLEGNQPTQSENDDPTQALGKGGGFGDTANNKLVETAAITAVTRHYESSGWSVRSVEQEKKGFDLECRKNSFVENVEVKGVQGSQQRFIITTGEIEQARANPKFVLIVVTSALSAGRVLTRYTGAEFCKRFGLSAVQYWAALRD